MLKITLKQNILTVVETLLSFNHTRATFWYYDIEQWKKSSTGKEGSVIDREMTQSDINWVKKHYLTKV
jgi:hypothetical protein